MNNELVNLSKESIEIASYLAKRAQQHQKAETYGDVCMAMKLSHEHTYSAVDLSRYLDEINKVSYPRASVLLSVLVVNQETKIPGKGFFDLAAKLRQEPGLLDPASWESFFNEECERVYKSALNKELNFFTDDK